MWVVDSKGFKVSREIYVGYDIATYGVRWINYEQTNIETEYKTEILERSYVGSSSEVSAPLNSFNLRINGDGGDFYNTQILASEASVSLISDTAGKYVEIARDGDEEKYKVKRYKLISEVWTLQWEGFVTPSSYSEEYGSTPYVTTITCHDRLADLKNLKFLNDADSNDQSTTDFSKLVLGEISQFQALNFCLSKLNQGFGYRISLNIFEDSHSTGNTTPLSQTYFTPDFYANIKDNDYSPDKCDKIVKDILKTYQAHIQCRDGYWYIIAWENLLSPTANYVEYGSDLSYVGIGSWSPMVDFKAFTATNRWRWMGGKQNLSFTDVYKRINLKINTEVKENGGLLPFNETTIQFPDPSNPFFKGFPTGFEGVSLIKGNNISQTPIKIGSIEDYNYHWKFLILDNNKSDTYMSWGGSLEYSATDKVRISADIRPRTDGFTAFIPSDVFPTLERKSVELPYLNLKWSFSLDSKYLTNGGNWSDSEVINEYYLDSEGEQKFEIEANYRDVTTTSGTYNLKIWIPTIYEYNYGNSTLASLIENLKGQDTLVLVDGTRRIARYGAYDLTGTDVVTYTSGYTLLFYELRFYELNETIPTSNDYTVVEPTDYNSTTNRVKWELVKNVPVNTLSTVPIGFDFSNIKLEHLPNGLSPLEENTISKINNINNKLELDYELNLYDLDNEITNDENTYVNYLKKSDSTATSTWTKTSTGKIFNPSSLEGLLLWLDASDTNASILNSTDVVSLLDKSESLAETNIYTSDFSSGVDGTTDIRITSTGGNNEVSDGTTSKDNCLESTLTNGSNNHQLRYTVSVPKVYNQSLWIYIPSSNTAMDGVRLSIGFDTSTDYVGIAGTWTLISHRGTAVTNTVQIYALDGSSNTVNGDGDVFYIASGWEINEIEGNHFSQTTSSNRPVIDNITNPTKVTFTASNSEYLENILDIATFTNLSIGSFTYINGGVSGEVRNWLALSNTANNNDRFWITTDSSNKANLLIKVGAGTTEELNSTTTLIDGDVVTWSQNGTNKTLYINGVEDTIITVTGSNGSQWVDSPTLDSLAVGSRQKLTSTYSNLVFRELIGTSTPLTDAQSLNLANYLLGRGLPSKSIQNQVLDRIVEWTKESRYRIQGSFISDTEMTSLNVLRDPTDSNRVYYPLGVSFNDYKTEYSGEVLELGSDDTVRSSARTTGYKDTGYS